MAKIYTPNGRGSVSEEEMHAAIKTGDLLEKSFSGWECRIEILPDSPHAPYHGTMTQVGTPRSISCMGDSLKEIHERITARMP